MKYLNHSILHFIVTLELKLLGITENCNVPGKK